MTKKFLLLASLIIGATSFAGVEGTATNVELPIISRGEVIEPTGGNLIIESTTTGMDATKMRFNFGTMKKPSDRAISSDVLEGGFKITRADGSVLTAASGSVSVGLDELASEKTKTTDPINTGITITYTLGNMRQSADKKVYTGNLTAIAKVDTNTTAGTFLDNSQNIFVIVNKGE